MLILNRRDFLKNATAFGALAATGIARGASDEVGKPYPGWKPGEMDLHFVYTGCGENMFYRLPDGTAILNDTGDFFRTRDRGQVPLLPSPDRLGGEWMARYIHRVYPEKAIDYAIFSHWHWDHVGHATFTSSYEGLRYRTTPDGRKINGFLCVAEEFDVKHYFDHEYPEHGKYKKQDSSMLLLEPWIEAQKKKGLVVEPFKVGALNQIALQRDPARYKDVFSIRNICANGVLWDGKDGVRDYAAEHVAVTKDRRIPQNPLSLAFVIQYGKFRYYAGGDVGRRFKVKGGGDVNYEGLVGECVGRDRLQDEPPRLLRLDGRGVRQGRARAGVRGVHVVSGTAGAEDAQDDQQVRRSGDSPEPHAGQAQGEGNQRTVHEEHPRARCRARRRQGPARRQRLPDLPP